MIDSARMFAFTLPASLGPYAVLLAIGFAVGWYGHGAKNNWIIAFGIVLILASIGLLQLAIATHNGRAPTGF
jgi:membrane protein YdbS with pleckstrin-like domain